MSRANHNQPGETKGFSKCAKTTLIWMYASLFALFILFTVSAFHVNCDNISLWKIL